MSVAATGPQLLFPRPQDIKAAVPSQSCSDRHKYRIVGSMREQDDVTLDIEDFPIACPMCGSQMRLFGIEWESKRRDIYTFVCDLCGHTVARGVLTQ